MKSIANYALTFLGYNNSVSAIVCKASVFHKWLYDEIKTYVTLSSSYVHTYLSSRFNKGQQIIMYSIEHDIIEKDVNFYGISKLFLVQKHILVHTGRNDLVVDIQKKRNRKALYPH